MNAFLTRNIEGIAGRSDHRRAVEDETWAETKWLIGAFSVLALGALLTIMGII